ncbi:CysS/YqeB C-terminal domain-containing protein [Pseudomonas putida]|uniref:CysS/YqeB C-terminal domain-containing protein n=1 Tax=Pseudomonas putida TaxID=303 RepID=UPI003D2772A4
MDIQNECSDTSKASAYDVDNSPPLRLLGLLQQPPDAALAALAAPSAPAQYPLRHRQYLESLLLARDTARSASDFAKADALRDELLAAGFRIENTPEGSKLRPSARRVI